MNSLRDQAIEKLRESFDLLTIAGIGESLQDLLSETARKPLP